MAACPVVKLDEAHNTFRLWVAYFTRAKYDVAACNSIEVDVSEYVEGGAGLLGRPPANILTVYVLEGENRVEVQRVLSSSEKLVTISLDSAELVAGQRAPKAFAPGQTLVFVIGVKTARGFHSHSMSGGRIVGG